MYIIVLISAWKENTMITSLLEFICYQIDYLGNMKTDIVNFVFNYRPHDWCHSHFGLLRDRYWITSIWEEFKQHCKEVKTILNPSPLPHMVPSWNSTGAACRNTNLMCTLIRTIEEEETERRHSIYRTLPVSSLLAERGYTTGLTFNININPFLLLVFLREYGGRAFLLILSFFLKFSLQITRFSYEISLYISIWNKNFTLRENSTYIFISIFCTIYICV